jgi:zinc protease
VGDFDPAQANAWIDKYFGRVPKPAPAIPRVEIVEPEQTVERTYTYRAANVPLPAVEYAYHIPAWRHPDAPALDIVETLLGMGKSSRLYQSLVYRQRVATVAHASADLREHPGLFSFRAIASTGIALADVRIALDAEIAKLQNELPAADEMERVRTQIASSFVRSRQTYNNIAVALVRSAIERDDPGALNSDLERYRAVTAADVQRVAKHYLTPSNRTLIEYLPQ